jgi:hypothetical protein
MSKPIRNDRRGRSASPPRPRGRLPRRVYWVRRVLVLGVAALLVLGITRLLSLGGGDTGGGQAAIVRSGTSEMPSGVTSPTTALSPTAVRTGRRGLAQPSGPCDPSDVLVTPVVTRAHVARPVRISLRVTSLQSPACTFEVSPQSVIVRLLSPKRSEPLWTSQHCTAAVPVSTVVARPDRPGRVPVMWNGRLSDEDCSNLTDWVFPGTYTAQAIAVGSARATSSEFVLGLPIRPTVTRTPTPTADPSASPSGTPSGKPAASPGGTPSATPSGR